MTPEFKRRLRREIRLFIREARDGCVDCIPCRGTCREHEKVFVDLILHPRKYVRISPLTRE